MRKCLGGTGIAAIVKRGLVGVLGTAALVFVIFSIKLVFFFAFKDCYCLQGEQRSVLAGDKSVPES